MSARHERHDCDTSETRAKRVRHECNTSATRTTQVQHECDTNDTSVARAKNFDFDNDTSGNILAIWQMKDYKEKEQFHSKNCLLEMSRSHAKMRLKSAPQKLNIVMAKGISKSYTLDCSANALARFCIVSSLCETNILFSKNY